MIMTLRRWLVLSHVLPLLVIVPLMGIALVYVLGLQVLLPTISADLTEQASLVAQMAAARPGTLTDPVQAQALINQVSPELSAQVMLFDASGRVLASDDGYAPSTIPGLAAALGGQRSVHTMYSRSLGADVADALVPVVNNQGRVLGVVRLAHQLVGVAERFARLRYLIAGVLAVGTLLSTLVGLALALNLEDTFREIGRAVQRAADGQEPVAVAEQGPHEARQLLISVNVMGERLRRLEENRRQLLASIEHELGRPLAALGSAIQALELGAAADPALRDELLSGMRVEVERLRGVLDDLGRLHDRVAGTGRLRRAPVALSRWLPELAVTWREAALQKGLRWAMDVPADLPVVNADGGRLAQAVGNLLSNAVKYTPPGGLVAVTAGVTRAASETAAAPAGGGRPLPGGDSAAVRRRVVRHGVSMGPRAWLAAQGRPAPDRTAPGGSPAGAALQQATAPGVAVWIRVRDTGPGIPVAEQAAIFEPFYRAATAPQAAPGMGLGLSIARDLLIAHGGRLEVESAPGEGSTFTIWLPCP